MTAEGIPAKKNSEFVQAMNARSPFFGLLFRLRGSQTGKTELECGLKSARLARKFATEWRNFRHGIAEFSPQDSEFVNSVFLPGRVGAPPPPFNSSENGEGATACARAVKHPRHSNGDDFASPLKR